MKYTIVPQNDINHGFMLSVRIPSEDVDWNALYTLESDRPSFVVPFHYHKVDDMIEITFLPGSRKMLRYFDSEKSAEDYAEMFIKLMMPLQSCGDWFLRPLCFLLDFNWIFFDSADASISYLYLPVKDEYMAMDDVIQMIRLTTMNVHVNDAELENKVLRTINNDYFTVSDFLRVFQHVSTKKNEETGSTLASNVSEFIEKKMGKDSKGSKKDEKSFDLISAHKDSPSHNTEKYTKPRNIEPKISLDDDDLLDVGDPDSKSDGFFSKLFRSNEEKQREKKERQRELQRQRQQEKENRRRKKEERKGAKNEPRKIISGAAEEGEYPKNDSYAQWFNNGSSKTVVDEKKFSGTRLEYIGRCNHEAVIIIRMEKNNMFKIGRFDTVLNKKQSDFEFPEDTKEVSRRHAVIEKINGAYYLIDIGSLAGTYVNGSRLEINEHFLLQNGDMVSFGKAGADYEFVQED